MVKKTISALLGLLASSIATAGTMGAVCTPGTVTVPCAAPMWELGAQALYLRAMYGAEKSYQQLFDPATGSSSTIKDVKNEWNWGYRLTGAYHFNTGNDVTVNWTHFSSMGKKNDIVFAIQPTRDLEFSADYTNRNRIDQVNAVLGQHVDLSLRNSLRFYAGMQYANIQSTAQTYLTGPFALLANQNVFNNTDYKGFGPSLGIDYAYDICTGLTLTANGSGSILYGTRRYHEGMVLTDLNVIYQQVYARRKALVPSVEAKLGLNYAYPMAQGVVNINAGYQVINYFNPLNAQSFQSLTAPISSVDYSLYGPYFGLKYAGNV